MIRRIFLIVTLLIVGVLVLPPLWYAAFPVPAPELPPPGRQVEVAPGVRVNLIEEGTGRPVVLVHGHPGCSYDWAPLMRELAARGHRVLAYDRLGYGRSDARTNGDFTVDANAQELLAVLTSEDLRDATVIGWSYGGGTSIVAARKDDTRMGRLVLVGSVGPGIQDRESPPPVILDYVLRPALSWVSRVPPLALRASAALTRIAFEPEPVAPGFLTQVSANFGRPHTLDTFRSEGRDLDGRAALDPAAIDLPILVVHGEHDRLVPLRVAEGLQRRGRRAELWVLPGGGHMLPVTRPEALAERIVAFAQTS